MNPSLVRLPFLTFLCVALLFAQDPAAGIPPRPKAADYAVQSSAGNAVMAASLVSAKQVRQMFAYDISDSYVVFEVACYPDSSGPAHLRREDFAVKGRAQGELMHQVEGDTVASVVQQKNAPRPPSRKPDVGGAVAVGYETATDPVTGRKVHGTYTDASVGVGIGGDASRYPMPSGGVYVDRDMLEAQLKARSLPEGKFDHPVAGYLFFPRAGLKTQADGNYVLNYFMDAKNVSLPVPGKTK